MDDVKARRAARNAEMIQRMRDGDPLMQSASASWWQPRGIIKKDTAAIKRLYDLVGTILTAGSDGADPQDPQRDAGLPESPPEP